MKEIILALIGLVVAFAFLGTMVHSCVENSTRDFKNDFISKETEKSFCVNACLLSSIAKKEYMKEPIPKDLEKNCEDFYLNKTCLKGRISKNQNPNPKISLIHSFHLYQSLMSGNEFGSTYIYGPPED